MVASPVEHNKLTPYSTWAKEEGQGLQKEVRRVTSSFSIIAHLNGTSLQLDVMYQGVADRVTWPHLLKRLYRDEIEGCIFSFAVPEVLA